MSLAYDEYLKEHKENVIRGLEWMRDNLPETIIDRYLIEDALVNAQSHDASKFSLEEYEAYDLYFYGENRSFEVEVAFNYAWLHHIHHNPHHWQHWVLVNDEPEPQLMFIKIPMIKPLEMPPIYIYEMIADWWSFSWKKGNLCEIFNWYDLHKNYMMLGPKTQMLVEQILFNGIFPILKMQLMMCGKWDDSCMAHSGIAEESIEDVKPEFYGVPEKKKFPLPDSDHVKSAIRFFNYVDPQYEEELAKAILEKAEEFGVKIGEDISVGDKNKFKKYIGKEST